MSTLHWVFGVAGRERLSYGSQLQQKISSDGKATILLGASEIRRTRHEEFDEEWSEDARRRSAYRDIMLARYLVAQDIEVVYCSGEEFGDVMEWARKNIEGLEIHPPTTGEAAETSAGVPARAVGTLYWLTGLSGAGKTTVGTLLYKKMRQHRGNVVLMDGDLFRDALQTKQDFTRAGREAQSYRSLRLAKLLLSKGLDFVWCTIGMIEAVRRWNRENLEKYVEIYLEVPMPVLEARDSKGLYAGVRNGTMRDVVGVDQAAEFPQNPEILIRNDGTIPPTEIAERIWQRLAKDFNA